MVITVLFLSSFSVRAACANSGFFLRLFKHKLKRVATRLFSHKRRDMNILWEKNIPPNKTKSEREIKQSANAIYLSVI